MKYTKATNYALHMIAFMVSKDGTAPLSLQPLAKHFEMSPTYLSKILAQLVKANLIHSATGANGGYRLRKKREEITFFDVVQAIEGSGALFTCDMNEEECPLQTVMREAEHCLEAYLHSKTIYEVVKSNPSHFERSATMPNTHHPHGGSTHSLMTKIEFLDSAMRQRTLPPEEILRMLPLQKGSVILDVGAGSGYLTIPAAKQTQGTVFALDMDARMLQVIDTKAKAEHISNIQLIQADIEAIPLPDCSVELVTASLILHELRALPAALAEINRVLKPGGHFLCLEYEKEEACAEGPPLHIRIPSLNMERALVAAGFVVEQKATPKEAIYILTAKKTGGGA